MDERVYARYMSDIAYFQSKLDAAPDSKYYIPVALAYNKLEKYQESIDVCRIALEHHQNDDAIKTLLAEAYVYTGHFEFAKELLFDIVTDNDFNYKAFKLLGIVYSSNEELGQALKYYKAAYVRSPEDTQLKQMIEDLGGSANPDDILQERKSVSHAQTEEEDDENKTYYEIDRHIKNAEMVMADFVADNTIAGPKRTSQEVAEEENTITDDEIERLLAGASGKPDNERDDIAVDAPEVKAVEDEDLKKFMEKAHAELGGVTEDEINAAWIDDEQPQTDISGIGNDNEVSAAELSSLLEPTEDIVPADIDSAAEVLKIASAQSDEIDELASSLLGALDSEPEDTPAPTADAEIDELASSLLGALDAEPEDTPAPTADTEMDELASSLLGALDAEPEDTPAPTADAEMDELASSLLGALDTVPEDVPAPTADAEIDELASSLLGALDSEPEDVPAPTADAEMDELASSLLGALDSVPEDVPEIENIAVTPTPAPVTVAPADDDLLGDLEAASDEDIDTVIEDIKPAPVAPPVEIPEPAPVVTVTSSDDDDLLGDLEAASDEDIDTVIEDIKPAPVAPPIQIPEPAPVVAATSSDDDDLLGNLEVASDEDIDTVSEQQPQPKYKLSIEDMVHDDEHDDDGVAHYDDADDGAGKDSAPFVQSGIFDEIMTASGMDSYADDDTVTVSVEEPAEPKPLHDEKSGDEAVQKLLKLQSKLMKLKGGK